MPETRRSSVVVLGLTAALATTLSGCSSEPDYRAVCVDPATQKRLPDYDCSSSHYGTGHWYYYPRGSRAAGIGSFVRGGSFSAPSHGSVAKGGFSSHGGVMRGGFGSHFSGSHGG